MGLLELVFPKKCVGCGKWGGYVCRDCDVGIWEEEQICPVCRRASRYGLRHKYCNKPLTMEGLTCLWAYEGIAKKLIKQAKYKYYYDYLNELMGEVGGREELFYLNKFLDSKPIVVPVPLHPKRQRERGFNQAEVIALSLASRHKLSLNSHLLQRVRDTGRQVERSREERLKAMSDAFKINPNFQISNSVLLVDDVWTTGATMSEAAKVLKQARVKVVWGWVLAR